MSRKDALLRLYNRLVTQRESLRQKLAEDLGLNYTPDDGTNDLGETALQVEQTELHSQLAALESREIRQIDASLDKIRDGSYGVCERCQKVIPSPGCRRCRSPRRASTASGNGNAGPITTTSSKPTGRPRWNTSAARSTANCRSATSTRVDRNASFGAR